MHYKAPARPPRGGGGERIIKLTSRSVKRLPKAFTIQETTPVLKEEGKKRDGDAVNEHLLKM
jgi:hypothetical protein